MRAVRGEHAVEAGQANPWHWRQGDEPDEEISATEWLRSTTWRTASSLNSGVYL
jgi:hypothetical protein